ncbi:hypothetical protein LBMAG42_03700 [Deltaproteobacteria bacterium]|nr:hypothetical protein LBMAG42_03700 [Deltaproteobacteria bacterium]
MFLLLGAACILDYATYQACLAELTDNDGDGVNEVEGDCNDDDAAVFPGQEETCNEADDDCDGGVDEADDVVGAEWYPDSDADGFGSGEAVITCEPPTGMVQSGGDCDDTDDAAFPGAPERCNGADDDCDGDADEADDVETLDWYADLDGDGWGSDNVIASCTDPGSASLATGDCDDEAAAVHPEATETCNGADDDCNGAVDDAPAVTWYLDRDEDGYGDEGTSYLICAPPPGYVRDGSDCDDEDDARHPGAEDACEDGVDNDCDGLDVTCSLPSGESTGADASASFTGTAGEAYMARTVAAAGDLDGDGNDELLLARGGFDDFTGEVIILAGGAELYLGAVDTDRTGTALRGPVGTSAFGVSLSAGQDTDGDGVGDILVGSQGANHAHLFAGGAHLLAGNLESDDATVRLEGPADGVDFGLAVALVGDVDDDGWGDWLVGDYGYQGTGAAFLFYGNGAPGTRSANDADVVTLLGERADAQAGQEVTGVGDFDGDGVGDFLVADNVTTGGETARNHAYLMLGSTSRFVSGALADADLAYAGMPTDSAFASVSGLGDIDGDGRDDSALSAAGTNASAGAVFVLFGDPAPTAGVEISDAADVTWTGAVAGEGLGASVGGPGEVTGDGYRDLAAATTRSGSTGAHIYILAGAAALRGTYSTADAWADVAGGNAEAQGDAISGASDVNGDGSADLLFSAWDASSAQGQAWLFYGATP